MPRQFHPLQTPVSAAGLSLTYRVQVLPHEHLEVVFVVQQLEDVGHLIVPANASQQAHLGTPGHLRGSRRGTIHPCQGCARHTRLHIALGAMGVLLHQPKLHLLHSEGKVLPHKNRQ